MAYRIVDPFSALLDFQRAIDSAHLSNWFAQETSSVGAFPPINVFSKGEDCVVVTEISGVKKSDINIQVKGNKIRLSGKKDISYDENVSVHRRERMAGNFDRTLTLPLEIDSDGIKAEYNDGVLAVFLPRAEADKPRSIMIS